MFRSLKLGTAFGIGIYVHWTFPLLLIMAAYLFRSEGRLGSLVMVGIVVLIFGCIILHELGHALMARRFGIRTRDITIFPIGGVARLEKMSERPWEEFMIAIAGPAVNVVIATGLALILAGRFFLMNESWHALEGIRPNATDARSLVTFVLASLMASNIVLVLFNMLPAFPMDGGRVLRAALSVMIGHLRATEVAAALGVVLASGLIVQGVVSVLGIPNFFVSVLGIPNIGEQPLFMVVGMFVLLAGQQELAAVRHAARRKAAMPLGRQISVAWPAPEPGFSGFTWSPQTGAWIEWREGRAVHACVPAECPTKPDQNH